MHTAAGHYTCSGVAVLIAQSRGQQPAVRSNKERALHRQLSGCCANSRDQTEQARIMANVKGRQFIVGANLG